jgi:hypothetical protein
LKEEKKEFNAEDTEVAPAGSGQAAFAEKRKRSREIQ